MNHLFYQYFRDVFARYIKHIDSVVSPIRTLLDLNYFSYQKITINNKYTLIADRPDYIEHYFDQRLYLDDLFVHDYQFSNKGLFLYPIMQESHGHSSLNKIIKGCRNPFQVNQQLVITRRFEKYYEIFCIGAPHSHQNVIPSYMNQLNLITTYLDHFKNMTHHLCQVIDEMNIDISTIKGNAFYQENPLEKITRKDRENTFLKAIDHQTNTVFKLSSQQIECLFHLAKGCRIKEIAKQLSLSPKTIEHYIASIKLKLACNTREELFHIALQIPSIKVRLLNPKS